MFPVWHFSISCSGHLVMWEDTERDNVGFNCSVLWAPLCCNQSLYILILHYHIFMYCVTKCQHQQLMVLVTRERRKFKVSFPWNGSYRFPLHCSLQTIVYKTYWINADTSNNPRSTELGTNYPAGSTFINEKNSVCSYILLNWQEFIACDWLSINVPWTTTTFGFPILFYRLDST